MIKTIRDTRYIIGFSEWITPHPIIRRLFEWLLNLIAWKVPFETKYFVVDDTVEPRVLEFSDVHFDFTGTGSSMECYPDGFSELVPSGHKHFGRPSFYPVC